MLRRSLLIYLLIALFQFSAQAQEKSNRGKEFWLAYGFDYSFFNETPINAQELAIYISTGTQPANVTVTIQNTSYSQTLSIPANTADATINIPKSGPNDARVLSDGLSNKGIHIVSDVPVAVYAHVFATMVSGATMLMPVETYGYVYHSVNYTQTTSGSNLPNVSPTTQNGPDWYSWFYVIASENNTRVQIVPADTTKNGWLPGQVYTVDLQQGESYHIFGKLVNGNNAAWAASKDMTGSKVTSVVGADGNCHPVAMFSGSGGIRICRGDGGEFMHQQVFPKQAWGTRYLTYHTINNTTSDLLQTNRNYYRVCVGDPSTVVKRNGVTLTGLQRNFYYEYMDSTGGDYIEADLPIMISQYTTNKNQCWNMPTTTPAPISYGDPEMFYLSPIEQGQKDVTFYVNRRSAIDFVYANIVLPTTGVTSLRVDGSPLPATQIIPHPNLSGYSVALARFIGAAAQHRIVCDSNFNGTVYGLGNYESYGYNLGTRINNLNVYAQFQNALGPNVYDTATCPNTPVKLYLKVSDTLTNIHWKISQAVGISPSTDVVIANPPIANAELINGRRYLVYTLPQTYSFATAGLYKIPVTQTTANANGCLSTRTDTIYVTVRPGMTADFSFTTPICQLDTVSFTGSGTTSGFTITGYRWDFPDASFQITQHARKYFGVAGTQNVRYRIFANNGCVADTTKPALINANPVAKLGVSSPICQGDSALISDTSTIANGSISSWRYDFGDGNILVRNVNSNFYHCYNNAGNFTVSLVLTSAVGCKSDTAFKTVTFNPKPIAKFGIDRNICAGDSVRFTDTSSISSGSIVSYHWNFGDGNTLVRTFNTPFYHAYPTAGTYTVWLVVMATNGCVSDTFRRNVIVNQKPSANFTISGKPCMDSVFSFTSTYNSASNPRWYWSFGDGNVTSGSTSPTITHAYAGVMSNIAVAHVVDLGGGCRSDTAFQTIPIISANPIANFSINKNAICAGESVIFSSANSNVRNWNWNFGNGVGNQLPPVTRTYTSPGSITATLSITDNNGCGSLPSTQNILVNASPLVNAGVDKIIRTGDAIVMTATVSPPSTTYVYTWTPATALSNPSLLNPVASPLATTVYLLKVTDPISNCTGADSVTIQVFSQLYIPNAFTPNGDGLNDVWNLPGLQLYPKAVVTVYNRYGKKIYENAAGSNRPWDGKFMGEPQPNGAYVYVIQLHDASNQVLKGTVLIIR